uniref:7TM_GPCR_Srx domain-containing protein n=1 Tax=Heterorhabditis bacteriophora TaxID=37862 RepID=A0A1I7W974_HETBA
MSAGGDTNMARHSVESIKLVTLESVVIYIGLETGLLSLILCFKLCLDRYVQYNLAEVFSFGYNFIFVLAVAIQACENNKLLNDEYLLFSLTRDILIENSYPAVKISSN